MRSRDERFAAKTRPASNGCIEWIGAVNNQGYGVFSVGEGRLRLAHRFAFEKHYGPVPNGLVVMHACDNPRCVNQDHLIAGSRLANMLDMARKGRQRGGRVRGEKQHLSKLNSEAVKVIRRAAGGRRGMQSLLARLHGVTQANVWAIQNNKTCKREEAA